MIHVEFSQKFIRMFGKLALPLQKDVLRKIELFKNPKNHRELRVHKLHGVMSGRLSFSVNFHFRIVFQYKKGSTKEVVLLAIGDHEIYD